MMALFDDEYIREAYGKEKFDEGENNGVIKTLVSLVSKGLLSVKDASEQAEMKEEDFWH